MYIKEALNELVAVWYKVNKDVFTLHIWIDEKWEECKVKRRDELDAEFISGEWFKKVEEELNVNKTRE
jgi:hypothetical protein